MRTPRQRRETRGAGACSVRLEHVRLIREAVHCEPARAQAFAAAEAREMPRLARHVDDVAGLRLELGQAFDLVANLAEHDEPELRAFLVVMAFVAGLRLLIVADDDVREA